MLLVAVLFLLRAVDIGWFLISAGLTDVPSGAVCMSFSQVLAYGQAAVRLRSLAQREERSLPRRKYIEMFVKCGFPLLHPLVHITLVFQIVVFVCMIVCAWPGIFHDVVRVIRFFIYPVLGIEETLGVLKSEGIYMHRSRY